MRRILEEDYDYDCLETGEFDGIIGIIEDAEGNIFYI